MVARASQGERMFFFEKKNQKTFPGCVARAVPGDWGTPGLGCLRRWSGGDGRRSGSKGQTFFGSFFQKRTAFFT
jgi:hypothetical protein